MSKGWIVLQILYSLAKFSVSVPPRPDTQDKVSD